MYHDRPWTMRQYSGFADARRTNERYRKLLERGQTGISVAFDLPTQMGFDPDAPEARGEVGRTGVSIAILSDMRRLLEGVPLGRVTVSMTINATAHILLAMIEALAGELGVPAAELGGTVQNDILKEFTARGCTLYPPEASMKIAVDVIEYCAKHLPRWNAVSVSGYHMREAGATAAQELGFTMANGACYVREAARRGLEADLVGRKISFFFSATSSLLEEVAKFRAARRFWARIMKERFGARDPASMTCRFHVQTAGVTLTRQQPENNIVRVALQAMAAVLGGAQSIHTNSHDEALSLPTERAAALALATQQILCHETGLRDVADPLGGSEAIEKRTDELEQEAEAIVGEIDRRGGVLEAVRQGYIQGEIEKSALAVQREIEAGDRVVVGVNKYVEDGSSGVPTFAIEPGLEDERIREIREFRAGRGKVAALDELRRVRDRSENLMPAVLVSIRSGSTLGEISSLLGQVYGRYEEVRPRR